MYSPKNRSSFVSGMRIAALRERKYLMKRKERRRKDREEKRGAEDEEEEKEVNIYSDEKERRRKRNKKWKWRERREERNKRKKTNVHDDLFVPRSLLLLTFSASIFSSSVTNASFSRHLFLRQTADDHSSSLVLVLLPQGSGAALPAADDDEVRQAQPLAVRRLHARIPVLDQRHYALEAVVGERDCHR